MANPILKNDLISDDALRALEEMSRLLREDKENMDALMASFKQYAGSIQPAVAANNSNNDALTAALQKVSELEKAYSDLQKLMKENAATQRAVAAEKRKYAKLNADEAESVKRLSENVETYIRLTNSQTQSLKGLAEVYGKNIVEIDIQKKSYNELYQTYNALKDALNKMTVEERLNTEAGKKLTEQSFKIRDTLNELQKSTGNYTLQVGKYRAAFDGLGYSFQQILREAPSALNIQQFFLAISNNIPLFMDQLEGYKKKQGEIIESLRIMEAEGKKGTEEYAKLANNVEGWGKHLLRSLLSWQTAIIAITFLIRQYGAKIIEWIKNVGKGAEKAVEYFKTMRQAIAQINAEVEQRTASLRSEFALINDEMERVKRGSEEWSGIVKRVNELTHSTLDDVKATPEEIKKVTAAYLAQQRQLEINKRIVAADVQNEMNRQGKAGAFNSNLTPKERESYMTWKTDDAGKEYMKLLDKYDKANYAYQRAYNTFAQMDAQMKKNLDKFTKDLDRQYGAKLDKSDGSNASIRAITEWRDKQLADYLNSLTNTLTWDVFGIREAFGAGSPKNITANLRDAAKTESWDKKLEVVALEQEITKFINENVENYSTGYMNQLKSMYKAGQQKYKKESGGHTPSMKDVDFLESELLDPYGVVELESSFDQKLAMLEQQEKKERQILLEKYRREHEDLVFNREKGLITEAEFKEQEEKLNTNYDLLTRHNYEGNFEKMGVIQRKYWNKRNELTAKEAEKEEKEAEKKDKEWLARRKETVESELKVIRRRAKTVADESNKNLAIAHNIGVLKNEMDELTVATMNSAKGDEEAAKRVEELRKEMEKLAGQVSITKSLQKYGSVGEIFTRNMKVGAQTKENVIANILGTDVMEGQIKALGADGYLEWLDGQFEEWGKSATESASTWYSTTMGYINDLISAYVELANAKAEAAAEATEAAQEEYDKEKALLEAGYASRVEATWAEYQEKKAAQEKAEADAKEAAKAQQQLNEAEAMGSLIVASANIWKTFSKIPTVGVPLALAALATMWGSFIQAKVKAAEVSKYGEGGFEVLEGGSHASGHDIDLGVHNRRGRRMRAEGKEGLGIFSRRAMEHYGANNIEAMVNSVNRLEFEGNAAKRMSLERSVGMAVLSAPRTDLHRVENSLDKLVSYGSRSRYTEADGTVVEVRKSGVVRYRK